MSTIYRKTLKGVAEIQTRAHHLAPRLRNALILVDGKKKASELAVMIQPDFETTLSSLMADGFIEPLAAAAKQPSADPQTAADDSTPSQDAVASVSSLALLRRAAVRQLNDQLGPHGETIAIRIERAKTMAELQPLLVHATQLLRNLKGLAAADEFAKNFIRTAAE
jgi:hypothetical protein